MRFSLPGLLRATALLAVFAPYAAARALPEDVTVKIFARPVVHQEGSRLQLLVRIPLVAFNDIQFPVRGPGYLDLARIDQVLPGVARYGVASSLEMFEGETRLPKPRVVETRAALASDTSFRSYEEALAHLTGPRLAESTDTFLTQVWFDILLEYPIQSDRSLFSINSKFAQLGVRVPTAITFIGPDSPPRLFEYLGDPGLVRLEPRAGEVIRQFFQWGFLHLLNGSDYLLFLFCAVLPFRRYRPVFPLACAFALASSLTFIASVLNQAPDGGWFAPLVETAIALTILYTALENIADAVPPWRRALVTLIFGLVYGFSFAFGLTSKVQFAGAWPLAAALAFNAGFLVCIALVLLILIPVLRLLLRFTPAARIEIIVLSVLIAHTAWHWMTERATRFSRFPVSFPTIDAALLAGTLRWLMIFVLLAGGVWFMASYVRRKGASPQ